MEGSQAEAVDGGKDVVGGLGPSEGFGFGVVGVDVGVDVGFETNTAMPREFLMEQMEVREKLDEAKSGADLDAISRELSLEKRGLEIQIQEKIDGRHDYAAAADLVRKLMFLERFGEDIAAAYESLDA